MKMSKIIIGTMRFNDRQSAIETVRSAIDAGFNYLDTSPCYCFQSEEENSECWVGEAINFKDYRSRVILSAKCSPGNGGLELGEFLPSTGFGVRTSEQLDIVFRQSLKRLKCSEFDYYHLWTTHTIEQFNEAFKKGGWYDGVIAKSDKWKNLGITTHADTATILDFLKSGYFSTVTIPLNIVNRTRIGILEYCRKNNIKIIAMNPLAGGLLAKHEKLKELAFRYLFSLTGVHILVGFSSPEEVAYAKSIQDSVEPGAFTTESIIDEVNSLIDSNEPRCTSCGYCMPCPNGINLGACLSYFNLFKYLKMDSAKDAFKRKQWDDSFRLSNCSNCGICKRRCPNSLPLESIIAEAKDVMYTD